MQYSRSESQQIQRAILDCELARYTPDESIDYIKEKTGFIVTQWSLAWRKRQLKQQTIAHLKRLQADQWAYKLILQERIATIETMLQDNQKLRLEVKDNPKHRQFLLSLNNQIADFNDRLLDLYLLEPTIASIGAQGQWNSLATEEGLSQQSAEGPEQQNFRQDKF